MFRVVLFIFATAAACLADMPELPKTPVMTLGKEQFDAALLSNSPQEWENLASFSMLKAVELAKSSDVSNAVNWLYTALAAESFAKAGKNLAPELKRIIMENLPAFYDFYETMDASDSMSNAYDTLQTLFENQPAKVKQYLRAAMALSLVYDYPLPANWPNCNVPDEPTQVSAPQEIFLYFSLRADKLAFDLNKLTIGELAFVMGIPGPLTELEGVFVPNFKPSDLRGVYASIKTDKSRERGAKSAKWDFSKSEFNLKGIKAVGAVDFEKTYYAWRVANANGVPCLFFNEKTGDGDFAWLAYMGKDGKWQLDEFRNPLSKGCDGRPLNPRTWRPLSMFDFNRIMRRDINSEKGMKSCAMARLAEALMNENKFEASRDMARAALAENPDNWRAYAVLIPAMARSGASSAEIDAEYTSSFEKYKAYPEQSIKMLNIYRANLIYRKKGRLADELFMNAIKPIFKTNPAMATSIFGDALMDMLRRANSHSEAMSIYRSAMRSASKTPAECFEYITKPAAKYFYENGDVRAAMTAIRAIESASGRSKKNLAERVAELKNFIIEEERLKKEAEAADKKNRKKRGGDF